MNDVFIIWLVIITTAANQLWPKYDISKSDDTLDSATGTQIKAGQVLLALMNRQLSPLNRPYHVWINQASTFLENGQYYENVQVAMIAKSCGRNFCTN